MAKLTAEQKNKAVTDQFIKAIENGFTDTNWVRPWKSMNGALATNPVTGNDYKGLVNQLLMMIRFGGGYFAGYGQWESVGAKRLPAKEVGGGLAIYHPIMVDTGNTLPNGKPEKQCVGFGSCTVHHVSQVEGWEPPKPEPVNPIIRNKRIDDFVAALDVKIVHGGDSAHFHQITKMIAMPHPEQFDSMDAYYATLLHEIVHWAGHKDNLNRRKDLTRAEEELVAEMGSVMLCVQFNVQQPEAIPLDHLQYVKGWLTAIKDDPKAIMNAGTRAQKALEFINKAAAQSQEEEAA